MRTEQIAAVVAESGLCVDEKLILTTNFGFLHCTYLLVILRL